MKTLPLLGMAACCFALNACVWAPGQHVIHSSTGDATNPYRMVPITAQLLDTDAASASPAAVPAALLAYKPEPYRIGPGDSLYITVWDHPELTSPAGSQQQTLANGRLVRPDGTLFYPYAGLVKAGGLTVEQLRARLSQLLAKYVPSPQVDITIINYGSQRVTLAGALNNTAPQFINVTPLTLAQAIGTANINVSQADLSDVVLTRDGQDYHLDLYALGQGRHGATGDIYLKGGDRIYVPYNDNHEVYVVGEVNDPQALRFKTDQLNLAQALGRAGGLNQNYAKAKAVYVIRGSKQLHEPSEIYQLDASSPAAYALASRFPVRAGDVVFVGASGVTRWNRFVSQLLPFSNIINNTANSRYYTREANQL
jgi:polysaccharide export outer membrane protein